MESAATAGPIRTQPSLTTLPREIRNHIYRYLVVSSRPIQVCHDHDSFWLYLIAGREDNDVSTEFLCHAVEGSELAEECHEEFFRNNIFDCSYQDLPRFLSDTTIRFSFQNNLVPTTTKYGYMNFEKIPWIRKVTIGIFSDVFARKASEHLAYLLQCPCLQQVEITIIALGGQFDKTNPIDGTIEAIARVCKSIHAKIGDGLIVEVQNARTKSMIRSPEPEDVSWMWEEPSEEAKARVGMGLGTEKENIQLLMSGGRCG